MRSRERVATCAAIVALAAALAGCASQAPPPQTPSANTEPTPPSPQAIEADKKANDAASNESTRNVGWISIAVGAGAGAVALGTSGVILYDMSVRGSECNAGKLCSQKGYDADRQIPTLTGWNLGAWIVAAVGLGAGAYLVITHPKEAQKGTTAIGVQPTGSGLGIGIRSTF